MTIEPSMYTRYWRDGWVIVEGVFPTDEVDRIARLAVDVSETQIDPDDSYSTDASADGAITAPRKVDLPFVIESEFRPFVLHPNLQSLLETLIGCPPRLFGDQIMMKPPRVGSEKQYHQDNYYFRLAPDDHVITAWIALDDVDEENGCLRYIDGSHRDGLLPHTPVPGAPHNLSPPADQIDLSKESLAIVGKGGVVFHHGLALHASHPNRSDRWRRGYATHWVGPDMTDLNGPDGRLATAYFNRPDLANVLP